MRRFLFTSLFTLLLTKLAPQPHRRFFHVRARIHVVRSRVFRSNTPPVQSPAGRNEPPVTIKPCHYNAYVVPGVRFNKYVNNET